MIPLSFCPPLRNFLFMNIRDKCKTNNGLLFLQEISYFSKDVSVGNSFTGVIESGRIDKGHGNIILHITSSGDVKRLGFKVMADTNVVVFGKKVDELARTLSLFVVQHF